MLHDKIDISEETDVNSDGISHGGHKEWLEQVKLWEKNILCILDLHSKDNESVSFKTMNNRELLLDSQFLPLFFIQNNNFQ